jgi:hypothetical protein
MAGRDRQVDGTRQQVTELDLGLKAASRRLLWRLGYSTRVDVPLRAVSGREGGRTVPSPESFTDLDVLGLAVAPDSSVRSSIVDCKTGGSSVITRMFWLRGLVEFFEADHAYLVRERPISKDARQLALRLNLTALTEQEVGSLEGLHQTDMPLDEAPLSNLFDPEYIARVMSRLTNQDKRLQPLLDFCQFDYWVGPEHQNLTRMVDLLSGASKALDGSSPIHTGIVLDCAWLYVVSAAHALRQMRTVHISDLNYGLSEYLTGGPAQLAQKREVAAILDQLKDAKQIPSKVTISVNPRFFAPLLELLIRLFRRGDLLTDVLRILEYQSSAAIAGDRVGAEVAFGDKYNKVAAKLAADVVDFLVAAAGLDPHFKDVSRELLLGTPSKAFASPAPDVALFDVGNVDVPPTTSAK